MTTRGSSCAAVALTLALASCGGAARNAEQPRAAGAEPNGALLLKENGAAKSASYAPTGAEVDARLDQPLDTRISSPGQPITATLVQPIRATDGRVLVPAGAQLRGKIARIDHVSGPRIELAFDTLVLQAGKPPVPIGLRLLSAQQSRYAWVPAPSGVTNVQPGGPQPEATSAQKTVEISMARGGALRLELTRPIVGLQ
jgi:hypothetical protein